MTSADEEDDDRRNWYEQLLYEVAGQEVNPLPYIVVWVAWAAVLAALTYWTAETTHLQWTPALAVSSLIYWFAVVPIVAKRRARRSY